MTVMEYAEAYPEEFAGRVAGLAFVSTTAEGHTHTRYGLPPQVAFLMRAARRSAPGCWPAPAPGTPIGWFCPPCDRPCAGCCSATSTPTPQLAVTMKAVGRASLRSIGGFRASIGAQHRLDTLAALGDMPAAVLVGDRDRLTPPACAESIAGALPRAELAVFPGAGHMLMLERPDEVTAALAAVVEQAAVGQELRGGYEQAA